MKHDHTLEQIAALMRDDSSSAGNRSHLGHKPETGQHRRRQCKQGGESPPALPLKTFGWQKYGLPVELPEVVSPGVCMEGGTSPGDSVSTHALPVTPSAVSGVRQAVRPSLLTSASNALSHGVVMGVLILAVTV